MTSNPDWYSPAGITCAVLNGNANVVLSGGNMIDNAISGQGFIGPDGRTYKVTVITDALNFTITPSYLGTDNATGFFQIAPFQGFQVKLAKDVADMQASVSAYTSLAAAANDFLQFMGSPVVPINRTPLQANTTLSNNLNEATVASASTADIGAAASPFVQITGTTTITSFGTSANCQRFVRFSGALTLTHNATSLILPGAANITTAAGDTAQFVSDGSGNWRCRHYQRASGLPISLASPTITGTLTAAVANFSGALATVSLSVDNKASGTSTSILGGTTTANQASSFQLYQGSGKTSWMIGANFNVAGALEITPSTAAGGSTFSTPSVVFGTDGSFLVGTTTNGGWSGAAKGAFVGNSSHQALSIQQTGTSAALLVDLDNTSGQLAQFYYNVTTIVGSITTNGTTTTYGTSSTKDVKDGIVPMDVAFARKMIAALAPSSYRHKADGSDGHGFVLEHAHANALKHGADLHKLGIVHLGAKVMDYGKVTPFLACVANDLYAIADTHEQEIAMLKARVAVLEGRAA